MEHAAPEHADVAMIASVIELEVALLDPAVRSDFARLDALLHPDFVEHGASGRIWTRQAILDELPLEGEHTPQPTASDLHGQLIADSTVLVTYRTSSTLKTTTHSSVWPRSPSGDWRLATGDWQMRFPQGTPISDQPDERP